MTRTTYAFALLAALAALVVAGCGGGSSSTETSGGEASSSASGSQQASSSGGGGMELAAAEVSGLGPVLVDSEGMTVYLFAKDKGTTSTCYGACEEGWPPVRTKGAPSAGEGAMSSQLGTTKRRDGTVQVTYAGHPLYTFVEDENPGEANGNESTAFGAKWLALDEAGSPVQGSATSAAGEEESSESSGGGYGY